MARADFQVLAGLYEAAAPVPFFTSQNITFMDDTYSPKVTGEIVSPYPNDLTNLHVCAIIYDLAGEIIGGGYTYLDFVPGNGKAAVEIPVSVAGVVAKVEIYASVYSLSDLDK